MSETIKPDSTRVAGLAGLPGFLTPLPGFVVELLGTIIRNAADKVCGVWPPSTIVR